MPRIRDWTVCRTARATLALALFLLASGCASRGNVSGKVTFKGKPMPGGRVTFVPEKGTGGGPTEIDPQDGSYRLDRLPAGKYKVGVQPFREVFMPGGGKGKYGKGPPKDAVPEGVNFEGPDPNSRAKEKGAKMVNVPENYTDPEQSGLVVTVKGGDNVFNIDIP